MANALSILHPNKALDGDKVIHWAEARWKRLTARGYGDSKTNKPQQDVKKFITQLTPFQRKWFDKFWNAYSKKKGVDGAAMRWHEMGELPEADYQHIVYAAEMEAAGRNELIAQGITPIYAQGWLNDGRYNDYPRQQNLQAKETETKRQEALREVRGDLAHWAAIDTDFARDEVEKIKIKLKEMEAV